MPKSSTLEQELSELTQSVQTLEKRVARQTSFWFIIGQSLLTGIMTAVGATLFAGIVIAILSRTIRSIYDVPVLGSIVESLPFEQQFEALEE